MAGKTFTLWATVLSWHDGDTFYGFLDQGFYCYRGSRDAPLRFRCALINAPELKAAGGTIALAYAEEIAPPGEYECVSYKPDEFGRPLVDLILPGGDLFSDQMRAAGQAVPYRR